tara:strand:+ start:855 stop:1454 length:600 start_codon:yes stop_codon:yes gene_type:complete
MSNKVDWSYLKPPLILFGVVLLIATLMIFVGAQYEKLHQTQYEQSLSTLRTTHTKYTKIINDIDLLEQYRNQFSEYRANGLVGSERRLSWVESLESTNETLQLPNISYHLLPQEAFNRPNFRVKLGVDIKSSIMDLKMSLLHEDDLFTLFEGLRQSIKTIFTVESCSVNRTSPVSSSLDTQSANLSSSCQLRWVTIDVK